jgi:hypothetical protein
MIERWNHQVIKDRENLEIVSKKEGTEWNSCIGGSILYQIREVHYQILSSQKPLKKDTNIFTF